SPKSAVIEFRAPASPAQSFSAGRPGRCLGPQPRDVLRLGSPECSPRTAGPQPRDVLRLGSPECSPRTAGPQPRDVLRLALPTSRGRLGRGASPPFRVRG